MEKESAQVRKDMLARACGSGDIENLKRVIESLQPTYWDFYKGREAAIDGDHAQMIRYIFGQKYGFIDRYVMQRALKASALKVLDIFKEFGWNDVNMALGELDPYGQKRPPGYSGEPRTALFYATHDPALVRYLLDQGANPNLGPQRGPGIGISTAFRQVGDSGVTLESAARCGNIETFDLLLAHGAVLSNAAPMHAAAGEQNMEIMAHLLELGVDLDEQESMTLGRPSYGSPLLRAMFSGKPQAVRFLLDHGASTLSAVPAAMDLSNSDRIQDEIRKMVIEVGER